MASSIPTATPTPTSVLSSDSTSERILAALVANAALATPSFPTSANSAPQKLSSLAAASSASASALTAAQGFLTSRLHALPSAARTLVGVWLLLLGLFLLGCGARSLFWGRELGRKRGTQGRGWLEGGVGGVLMGSTVIGTLAAFLTLAIVSKQDDPYLGGWGTLAIAFCPGVVGAVVGGRWSWAGKVACAVLGSLSFTLLLCTSIRISTVLPRDVVFLVLLILALPSVFFHRVQRFSLPALSAFAGAYLFTLGIDCFATLGFVDALGLLVATNGAAAAAAGEAESVVVQWTMGGGKGLLAGWWIMAAVGGAWQGWWGLGIEGDENWNAYLSHLISTHPSSLGTHLPPLTFMQRLRGFFSRSPSGGFTDLPRRRATPWDDLDDEDERKDAESVPWDVERGGKHKHGHHHHRHQQHQHHRLDALKSQRHADTSDAWDSDVETLFSPATLRRAKSPTSVRSGSSKPARYGALSASDDEDDAVPAPNMAEKGSVCSGLSGRTAVASLEGEKFSCTAEERKEEAEDDAVAALPILDKHGAAGKDKKGTTLKRLFSPPTRPASYRTTSSSSLPTSPTSPAPTAPPPNAVPATPSLLLALDRVRRAQHEARSTSASSAPSPSAEKKEKRARAPVTRRESLRLSGVAEPAGEGESPEGARERRASMDSWWGEVVKTSEGR
ncbi:hypothetical protein JCM10207_001875 [Rhodosporidiobolus poonsookiae]